MKLKTTQMADRSGVENRINLKQKLKVEGQTEEVQVTATAIGVHQKKKLGLKKQKVTAELSGTEADTAEEIISGGDLEAKKQNIPVKGGKIKGKKQNKEVLNEENEVGVKTSEHQSVHIVAAKRSKCEESSMANEVGNGDMKYRKLLNICKQLQDIQRKKHSLPVADEQDSAALQNSTAEVQPVLAGSFKDFGNDCAGKKKCLLVDVQSYFLSGRFQREGKKADNTLQNKNRLLSFGQRLGNQQQDKEFENQRKETGILKMREEWNASYKSKGNEAQTPSAKLDSDSEGENEAETSVVDNQNWQPPVKKPQLHGQPQGARFHFQHPVRKFYDHKWGRGRGSLKLSANSEILMKRRSFGLPAELENGSGQSLLRPAYMTSHQKGLSAPAGSELYPSMQTKQQQIGAINDPASDLNDSRPVPSWLKQKKAGRSHRGRGMSHGGGRQRNWEEPRSCGSQNGQDFSDLHPSWQAKKINMMAKYEGKRIKFDD